MELKKRSLMSAVVFILGIAFIVYGVHRGEVNSVFAKAIRICLECVGIG